MEEKPPPFENAPDGFVLVSSHAISRNKALLFAMAVGVGLGVVNLFAFPDLDFSPRLTLFLALAGAVVTVTVVHEGVHGAAAFLLGHRPLFGLKPPFVYVTFDTKIPRAHFILVALAPLVLLDVLFTALFFADVLPLFFNFCFAINTLGAVGDVWMVWTLLGHERGTLIQDTKTGFEVWKRGAS